jgi:hypothetical protein
MCEVHWQELHAWCMGENNDSGEWMEAVNASEARERVSLRGSCAIVAGEWKRPRVARARTSLYPAHMVRSHPMDFGPRQLNPLNSATSAGESPCSSE